MKKSLIILTILSLIAVASSCGTNNDTNTSDTPTNTQEQYSTPVPTKNTKIEKNIDAVAEFLELENGSETLYSMIGAIDGKEYNDGNVELYQFDENDDAYKQMIGENASLNVSAYNEGIVLIFPAGQTPDDEMIDKFNGIEFK